MLAVDRERHAIKESATLRSGTREKAIHRRHEPEHAKKFQKCVGTGRGCVIDANGALRLRPFGATRESGADVVGAACGLDGDGDGPGFRPAAAGDVSERGAAQSTARREERHGLEQIGLARPVRSGEHNRPLVERKDQAHIVAEIGELEA